MNIQVKVMKKAFGEHLYLIRVQLSTLLFKTGGHKFVLDD